MNTINRTLILNVDDNDGARYAKSRVLKLAGFDVREAATGAAALEAMTLCKPDVVLLDMKLPDIHGLDVCRQIKGNPETASTLVLQTSASLINSSDKILALDGGADNYLVEPIEGDELIANINALLRMRKAERLFHDAQQALLESEERFRQMAENINDVFWIMSPADQSLLYVSPAYEKLWDQSPSLLYADVESWIETIHPEDQDQARSSFRASMLTGYNDVEFRVVHRSGEMKWIRARSFPVQDKNGQFYRIAGIAQDVSARKEADEVLLENARILAEQKNRLEVMVAERTAALSSLSIHLQDLQEQERAQLARELHDELGSVLTAAQMDIGGVMDQLEAINPACHAKLKRAMDTLQEGVTIKRRLLEGLRPSALEHLGISGAIRRYAADACERAGLKCHFEIAEISARLEDRIGIALYRIAQEALTNVVKHANAGEFRMKLSHDDERIELVLEDDGVGFRQEDLARIGHHGVAGMRQRIIALNGAFTIENIEPRGARIRVSVPAQVAGLLAEELGAA